MCSYLNIRYHHLEIDILILQIVFNIGYEIWSNDDVGSPDDKILLDREYMKKELLYAKYFF